MWLWSGEMEGACCNTDNGRQATWNIYSHGTRGVQRRHPTANSQIRHLQFWHSSLGTLIEKESIWRWYRYTYLCAWTIHIYYIRYIKVTYYLHLLFGITFILSYLCSYTLCLKGVYSLRHPLTSSPGWRNAYRIAGVYSLRHPVHFVTRVTKCIIVFCVYYSVYNCFTSKASRRYHNYVERLQHLKLYCCKSDT